MNNLFLTEQKSFIWQRRDNLCFIGYVFDESNKYFDDERALELFSNAKNKEELKVLLNKINGVYSLVIKLKEGIVVCSSHMRYFPLFYTKINEKWTISDSCEKLVEIGANNQFSEISKLEYLKQGFVRDNRTLYSDIFSVQSGEIVLLNEKIHNEFYYFHPLTNFEIIEKSILKKRLKIVIDNVGLRLANSLKGKTPVLPLSGGYDSRLIAYMLKNAGFSDVICFSYGKPNPESEISEKVAKELGYKWLFVDYTKIENLDGVFNSEEFHNYAHYAANGVSMPFLQEYPAIKELHERKLIPENSVFIPGHAGGFIAGSFMGYHIFSDLSYDELAKNLFETNYNFASMSISEKKKIFKHIQIQVDKYNGKNRNLIPYTIAEGITQQERMTKFIINSSKVFNYFGYETRFPFWDYEIESFFRYLPYKHRLNKTLFKEVVESTCFKPNNILFKKELQPTASDYFKQNIKKPFKKFLPQWAKKNLIKKNDWMCYNEFTAVLQKKLKDNNIKVLRKYNEYNAIICYWYLNLLKK